MSSNLDPFAQPIGVVVGALIGFGSASLTNRWSHREQRKLAVLDRQMNAYVQFIDATLQKPSFIFVIGNKKKMAELLADITIWGSHLLSGVALLQAFGDDTIRVLAKDYGINLKGSLNSLKSNIATQVAVADHAGSSVTRTTGSFIQDMPADGTSGPTDLNEEGTVAHNALVKICDELAEAVGQSLERLKSE